MSNIVDSCGSHAYTGSMATFATTEALLALAKTDISSSLILEAIEGGLVSQSQFRLFAGQRYLASQPFEELLVAGIKAAKREGDAALVLALQQNLDDERGLSTNGNFVGQGQSHEVWRQDFYGAIGLSYEELKTINPLAGTQAFIDKAKELITSGDSLKIGGGLLVLEGTIPLEFRRLQKGRDILFPNLSPKAKLYLDDHIYHDAEWHYPAMVSALQQYINKPDFARIVNGTQKITDARKLFFVDLAQCLLVQRII